MKDIENYLTPELLMQLGDYSLMARTAVEGVLSGLHRSVTRGNGGEFVHYRPYMPGDDLKYVDWRLFGRSGRVFEKVFEEETDMRCAIMVDASASMGYRGEKSPCSKLVYASVLASCFAYLALKQGDRPGLFVFSDRVLRATRRGQRVKNLPELLQLLDGIEAAGVAEYEAALQEAEDFLGRKHGMVIVISDLWGTDEMLERTIRRIRFAERDCIVCHLLDDDELALPFDDTMQFVDSESGESIETAPATIRDGYCTRVSKHISGVREVCLKNQADYILVNTLDEFGKCLRQLINYS